MGKPATPKTTVLQSVYTPTDVANYTMDVIDARLLSRRYALRSGAGMLDTHMKPVLPGEVINVLAYTSHGKTAFMQSWARNVIRQLQTRDTIDEMVVYLTWETLVEELGLYDLAAMTGIDSSDAWYGDLRDEQVNQLRTAAMKRTAMPLWVMGYSLKRRKESGSFTMKVVSEGLRSVEDNYGLRPAIIFVDYLQTIDPLNPAQERRIQVLRNVDALKQLARQCGCPVVNGVQAGRDCLTREFKLPEIGDGQETSRSEQDADKVIALWYPCKTEVDGAVVQELDIRVDDRLMIFGIRKQRHAASGQIFPLHFDPETNTFTDWVERVEPENHTEHQSADTEEIPF